MVMEERIAALEQDNEAARGLINNLLDKVTTLEKGLDVLTENQKKIAQHADALVDSLVKTLEVIGKAVDSDMNILDSKLQALSIQLAYQRLFT